MDIRLNYFGMLTEITGCASEQIKTESERVSGLISQLMHKYPDLAEKQFQIAQNHEIVTIEDQLSGAEIALLPPFSGG